MSAPPAQRRWLNPRRPRRPLRRTEQEPALPASVHRMVFPRQPRQLQQLPRSATSAIQHVNLPGCAAHSGATTKKFIRKPIADLRTYVQITSLHPNPSTPPRHPPDSITPSPPRPPPSFPPTPPSRPPTPPSPPPTPSSFPRRRESRTPGNSHQKQPQELPGFRLKAGMTWLGKTVTPAHSIVIPALTIVIPAQAGIQQCGQNNSGAETIIVKMNQSGPDTSPAMPDWPVLSA